MQAEELAQLKDAGGVHAFYDDAVVFFLVAQPCHIESLKSAKARIECRWGSKLSYLSVPQSTYSNAGELGKPG